MVPISRSVPCPITVNRGPSRTNGTLCVEAFTGAAQKGNASRLCRSDLLSSRSNGKVVNQGRMRICNFECGIVVTFRSYVSHRLTVCYAIPRFIAPGAAMHVDVLQNGLP